MARLLVGPLTPQRSYDGSGGLALRVNVLTLVDAHAEGLLHGVTHVDLGGVGVDE